MHINQTIAGQFITTFWEDFDVAWLENAARIDKLPGNGLVDVHAAYGDYCYRMEFT